MTRAYLSVATLFLLCTDYPTALASAGDLAGANRVRSVRVLPDTIRLERTATTADTGVAVCEPSNGGTVLSTPCGWTSLKPSDVGVVKLANNRAKIAARDTGFAMVEVSAKNRRDTLRVAVVPDVAASLRGSELFDTVATVLPHSISLVGAGARETLQGHCRDPFVGPLTGATWAWTVRNAEVVQPITSTKSAVTVIPLANGTSWIVGTCFGTKRDSSLATVSGVVTGGTVAGCPQTGYDRLVNVSTVTQLNAAKNAALPGDQIRLAAGTYALSSDLVLSIDGTAAKRITLCGPRTAVISGWTVMLNADYWHLRGFTVRKGLWGVYTNVAASHNIIDSLQVDSTRQEAIHLRLSSKHNEVRYTYIHHTGQVSFGEGIYLGSGATGVDRADSNWIHHNVIGPTPQECIESKEGTTGNVIEWNILGPCGTANSIGSEAAIILRGDSSVVRFNNILGPTSRYSMYIYPDCGGDGTGACSGGTVTAGRGNVMEGNRMAGVGGTFAAIFVRSTVNAATNTVYCSPSNVPPTGHALLAGGISCTAGGTAAPTFPPPPSNP